MSAQLEQARTILRGEAHVSTQPHRVACWLTRAALEQVVRDLLAARGLATGGASMRTLLSCLEVVYRDSDPEVAMKAEYAWAGLSRACHHHAYELAPTLAEAQQLTEIVGELATLPRPVINLESNGRASALGTEGRRRWA